MIELPVPSTSIDRLASVACHGTFLFGFPVVGPAVVLLIALVTGQGSPFIRQQAWQSLVFQLGVTVIFFLAMAGAVGLGLLAAFQAAAQGGVPDKSALWGIGLALFACLFAFWALIVEGLALVATLRGRPAKLPLVGGLGL